MLPYFLGEFLGTALLILLGCGVVANVTMSKSGMKHDAPSVQITFAWGFAVMLPAFIFAGLSGSHFNPALSIALAVRGEMPVGHLPIYFAGQFLGAILGACLVYVLYKEHIDQNENPDAKRGVFCCGPSVPHPILNCLSEVAGTFVLVFAIMGIGNVTGLPYGVNFLFVWAIIVSIGMSLGGLTGYAINPARDWGPRIAHTFLPIKGKGSSRWDYAWVTMVGPIVGGLLAAGLFSAVF
jgi:glycerol uptake facilitator protein